MRNAIVDALSAAESGMRRMGWYLCSGRATRARTIRRCVQLGYLRSAGMCSLTDDDGFHRHGCAEREGFEITDVGKARLAQG